MSIILSYFILALAAFCGAMFGAYLKKDNRKSPTYRITKDEVGDYHVEQNKDDQVPGKVEFISEPNAEDEEDALEEINRPAWKKFLSGVFNKNKND